MGVKRFPYALLCAQGVTATDMFGDPIEVEVSPDSVDTSVQGQITEVYYTATDDLGNSRTVKGRILIGMNWPEVTICSGWQIKDFNYDGNEIKGFSNSGKAKIRANGGKIGCWPKVTDKGEPVKAIGKEAFPRNGITSLPDNWENITTIGDRAFAFNPITKLPEWGNVTDIGEAAFFINKITKLPEWGNVTTLGNGAFSRNKLTSLPEWGPNIASIGNNKSNSYGGVFDYNQITSLPEWGPNVTFIGYKAFSGNKLTSLPDWGPNITTIGDYAFSSNQLTNLPEWGNIKDIGVSAFSDNKLTSLPEWGKNIETISNSAFSENQLTSLPEWGSKITTIGYRAFSENQLTSLPEWGPSIKSIGGGAFYNNQLTSLPDTWANITTIEDNNDYNLAGAFENNKLTSLPEMVPNLTKIGSRAFYNNQITNISGWGENVETIGKYAFSKNQLIGLPKWGQNVATIGEYAFSENQLTSLPEWGSNITTIGEYAFSKNQITGLPEWGPKLTHYTVTDGADGVSVSFTQNGIEEIAQGGEVKVELTVKLDKINPDGLAKNTVTLFPNQYSKDQGKGIPSNEVVTKHGDIVIHKVDAGNKKTGLKGAVFTLHQGKDANCQSYGDAIATSEASNEEGYTSFKGVQVSDWVNDAQADNTYCLVETKAPEGYQLLPKATPFKLTHVGGVTELAAAPEGSKVEIENHKSLGLPLTGGVGIGLVSLAGAAALAGGVTVAVRRSKKNQDK